MTDEQRTADEDNPKGYFELERVKQLDKGDTAWVAEAQGKVVKVLGTQDGWYQIGSGYIDAAYTEAATYEEALEQLYIRVVQGPLNIRSGPGTGSGTRACSCRWRHTHPALI